MNGEQQRFLWLHQRQLVTKWAWHFGDTQLRAYTSDGRTATISSAGLNELVSEGLMTLLGYGVRLTDAGRKAAA